jgi:hypothetical protein
MNGITVVKMARKMHKFQVVYTGYRVYEPKGFIKFNLARTKEVQILCQLILRREDFIRAGQGTLSS